MKVKVNLVLTLGLISLTLTSCEFSSFISAYESFQNGLLEDIVNGNNTSSLHTNQEDEEYEINLYDDFNDTTYKVNVKYDSYYKLPILEDINGYEFVGWVDINDNLFENSGWYYLNKNIDLFAKFEKFERSYRVIFNEDNFYENLTVWTDFEINGTIAILPENISNKDLTNRHSVPLTKTTIIDGIDESKAKYYCGAYYYAVDKNGYIVYASYGTGSGYGSPRDSYYYNSNSKNVYTASYWSLHDNWSSLLSNSGPNYDLDGDGVLEEYKHHLYDFLIPEGGFVVKGYFSENTFINFYKCIHDTYSYPEIASNLMYEYFMNPGDLDKWKLSIKDNSVVLTLR